MLLQVVAADEGDENKEKHDGIKKNTTLIEG
jgi:hypothetical protein